MRSKVIGCLFLPLFLAASGCIKDGDLKIAFNMEAVGAGDGRSGRFSRSPSASLHSSSGLRGTGTTSLISMSAWPTLSRRPSIVTRESVPSPYGIC